MISIYLARLFHVSRGNLRHRFIELNPSASISVNVLNGKPADLPKQQLFAAKRRKHDRIGVTSRSFAAKRDCIGLYRENAIAIQKDSGDSNGGNV